jgi:hypothetical protein
MRSGTRRNRVMARTRQQNEAVCASAPAPYFLDDHWLSSLYRGATHLFVIRVAYPGGHSVWLTRRFPTVAWGLKKDALPFPTEADAARMIARLRPSGPVTIEPIP